ncbi:hypothetical protein QZH41_013390 [Actinostola sp. cb2023]|nr:hypothetical protein QZH41_013390 [Actinostola sp. cb2023]
MYNVSNVIYMTYALRPDCDRPLGMEDGTIPDSSITSSSMFVGTRRSDPYIYYPYEGRLRNSRNLTKAGCWAVASNKQSEYLQVDLGRVTLVTKVAMQGNEWANTVEYVTSYKMFHSVDGLKWYIYKEDGLIKVRYEFMLL